MKPPFAYYGGKCEPPATGGRCACTLSWQCFGEATAGAFCDYCAKTCQREETPHVAYWTSPNQVEHLIVRGHCATCGRGHEVSR